MKLPDMPMGALSVSATIHKSKVYISAISKDEHGQVCFPLLVYSTNKTKWSTLPAQQAYSSIAVVSNHITSIGGQDVSTEKTFNTLSTWYEEEGQWKQVLPPMPTKRGAPAVISHNNLLMVTGGLAEDASTVLNTTDVLDLTTMKWTTQEGLNLPVPLREHHLVLCSEYIYLVGGTTALPVISLEQCNSQVWRAKWSDVKQTATSQHSQPRASVWSRIADSPTLLPTAVSCGGALYTVGGMTREVKSSRSVHAYDTTRNQWVSVGDMSVKRCDHCAMSLSNNSMFVAGGQDRHRSKQRNEGKVSFFPSAELLLL